MLLLKLIKFSLKICLPMRTMFHHVDCLFPGVWLAGEDHSTTLPIGDVTHRVPERRRTLSLLPPEVNTTLLLALRWFCQKNDQHIHINGVWEPEYQTVEQYRNQTYSLKLSHRSRHFHIGSLIVWRCAAVLRFTLLPCVRAEWCHSRVSGWKMILLRLTFYTFRNGTMIQRSQRKSVTS